MLDLFAEERLALRNPVVLSAIQKICDEQARQWAERAIQESQSDNPNVSLLTQYGAKANQSRALPLVVAIEAK